MSLTLIVHPTWAVSRREDVTEEVVSNGAMVRFTTGNGRMVVRRVVVFGRDRMIFPMWVNGTMIPFKALEYSQKKGLGIKVSSNHSSNLAMGQYDLRMVRLSLVLSDKIYPMELVIITGPMETITMDSSSMEKDMVKVC